MPRRPQRPKFDSSGKCYAYLRVSTTMQEKSGLGLMSQGNICYDKAVEMGLNFGNESCDTAYRPRRGVFVDAAQSAFTTPFHKRKAGGLLLETMQPGDTLIVSRLDRAFRNMVDFCLVTGQMMDEGKLFLCCSPAIDLTTASGRLMGRQFASLAEWESDLKGERIRASLAKQRELAAAPQLAIEKTINCDSAWRPVEKDEPPEPEVQHEPGRVHLYIRCSHRDSLASGLGLAVQLDVIRARARRLMEANPLLTDGKLFVDPVVSATKMTMKMRHGGLDLHNEIQKGDYVLFSSLDRGFRNIADMASTLPNWIERGAHIQFITEGIDTDTPEGRFLANVMVTFAQYETDLTSQRNKEARAELAARGRFCGGREPSFWRVYKKGKEKRLILDRAQLVAFTFVDRCRRAGMSVREALTRSEELHAKHWHRREGRVVIPLSGAARCSVISNRLPPEYPRDGRGTAWPLFSLQTYDWANRSKGFEPAMAAWRAQAAERRANRDAAFVEKPEELLRPLNSRGWHRGINPQSEASKKAIRIKREKLMATQTE